MGMKFIVRHPFKHAFTEFIVQNFHAQVCQDILHSCSFDLKKTVIYNSYYYVFLKEVQELLFFNI
jgi:hypothetical protein